MFSLKLEKLNAENILNAQILDRVGSTAEFRPIKPESPIFDLAAP